MLQKVYDNEHFPLILGRSTHNQRIERLWRDVFGGCLSLFYNLFYFMEHQGILNPDDESHIWCLHYVYLPVINRHLKTWRDTWINHPIRTERNRTPLQLWVTGLQLAGHLQATSNDTSQVAPYTTCNNFHGNKSFYIFININICLI